MSTLKRRCVSSCLILALIFSPAANAAVGANDWGGADKKTGELVGTINPSSTGGPRPIGSIESLGTIRIDGHIAQTGAALSGGELLQAPPIESAMVSLSGVGQIKLGGGAMIKLASVLSAASGGQESPPRHELFASLLAGEISVRLQAGACARIGATRSVFVLPAGSSARIGVREGRGVIISSSGPVAESYDWREFRPELIVMNQEGAQTTPGEYKIEPYNFKFDLGGYADIEARSLRYLQFRVTDKDDKDAPDLALLILLKNRGPSNDVGAINYGDNKMEVVTDPHGVVSVRFDASATVGSVAEIEITIKKNNQVFKGKIRIVKPKGFWTMKNAGPVMGVVAAVPVIAVALGAFPPKIPPRPPLSGIPPVVVP
ncbi:MAG TPA: hypothetical protein VJ810_33930 [Blastocatellia bacterium]|nr:hypothetical protein [Blastocatellia bacterium]